MSDTDTPPNPGRIVKEKRIGASYNTVKGYPRWEIWDGEVHRTVYVHQLLAISKGYDPHDVYSAGNDVHHKNGVTWDNREENLELLTKSQHFDVHRERGDYDSFIGSSPKYTDEEMLDWIESFVQAFGVVPTEADIRGWPGPSEPTYRARFGLFIAAVEQAGHTPRRGK